MISCQRPLFDIPENIAYLNCAAKAPMLTASKNAGYVSIEDALHPWNIHPSAFFKESEKARGLFARLINADAGDIAIIPSTSYGVTLAGKNLKVGAGRDIVILEGQFPSNVYPWMALAKQNGARLKVIARPEDYDWTPRILEGIDENTAVVALANCLWTDGSSVDLILVGEKARAVGAGFVVDGTQSVGAMGCDVRAIKPDFLVVSSYKWLFGPYSLGFLYADPRHHGGEPLEYNWITRAGSEDFSNLVKYTEEYHDGARRFDMGARSHINIIPMAIPALEQLIKWDPEHIQKTLGVMTDLIEERGRTLGLIPVPKKRRVGHIVGLRFPRGVPRGLIDQLHREKIFVSVRDDAIRVSPHLYNTTSDVERLFSVMKKFF